MDARSPYLPPRPESSQEAGELPPSTARFVLRTGAAIFLGMALVLVGFTILSLSKWGNGVPNGVDPLYAARETVLYKALQGLVFTGLATVYLISGRKLFRYQRDGVIWGRWISLFTALLELALFGAVVLIAREAPGYDEARLLGQVRSETRTIWIQLIFPLVMLMNLYHPLIVQWMKTGRRG